MEMTKKLLLAALVAGIFTMSNGFATTNNEQNTQQNSQEEQVTEEEENHETIFTPVNCAIGTAATAAVVIGAYFGLKKFADIDLYSKLSNLFRKQEPKVEAKTPEIWFTLFGIAWQKRYVRNTIGDIWTKIQNKLPKTAPKNVVVKTTK